MVIDIYYIGCVFSGQCTGLYNSFLALKLHLLSLVYYMHVCYSIYISHDELDSHENLDSSLQDIKTTFM